MSLIISQKPATSPSPPDPAPAAKPGAADDFLIVGIGASAGGLEALKVLVPTLDAGGRMAFILVQHLEPSHETMMVELLSGNTPLKVCLAEDGMAIESGHLYVIPPGTYLSVADGALRLERTKDRHGARLPFDHLLHSMAKDLGRRAACVILSGGGADGSLGLKTVRAAGGLVIVQDPEEAASDSMPRSAIMTGDVDMVVPIKGIAAALAGYSRRAAPEPCTATDDRQATEAGDFSAIMAVLRARTTQDFSLYKKGTLERRIERRMAMASIRAGDSQRYLALLNKDPAELDHLAKDLLIHVTQFFRDPKVFDLLSATVLPNLIRDLPPDRALRVWVAGCSTGEETYSLAILLHEQVAATGRNVKLQIFASDVDDDAITCARTGFYPDSIAAQVTPVRLGRFFSKEDDGYRVSPDLRASIVFTVQDVLVDPPFSRIDLVSCRNLLIYLGPDAQKKVISLFHFAIRDDGVLLLGNAETLGKPDGHFEVIDEKERLYRRVGRARNTDVGTQSSRGEAGRLPVRSSGSQQAPRKLPLAELCRAQLLETYAPAAVISNRENVCLYFYGQTDIYLKAAEGLAVHDVLAMARDGVRTKLRSAIQRARSKKVRVVVGDGRIVREGATHAFGVAAQPVGESDDDLILICFVPEPKLRSGDNRPTRSGALSDAIDLEHELEAVRTELESAIRGHEASDQEQKAVNEEALSVNEEYQSTNEELISSKEELQSLNEELSALNGQLQETLERERTTSNDMQNVLCSTDVATLFLDVDLKIRFFTPAIRALFSVIPSDVGRPLSDLNAPVADGLLQGDVRDVLKSLTSIEREIEARDGVWFSRRVLPYRTRDGTIEGVVITFTDVTGRKRAAEALEQAKQQAERANAAKSRFLAAASHDLRQPLQTLTLLQNLLGKATDAAQAKGLIARSEEALAAMSGMLNKLLDINEIEAGAVSVDIVAFPIDTLFGILREEFEEHARAHQLDFRVVPCSLVIDTDPRLLEQMIRNLLVNAFKYTKRGKVLLGCRRREGLLSVEVLDTGVGIPKEELSAIFEEYHQVDNIARNRSRGLGLGLSIVQRLGNLLGHRVSVRSRQDAGSVFAVEAKLSKDKPSVAVDAKQQPRFETGIAGDRAGSVLIIEDDADVRAILELYLATNGFETASVGDGAAAFDLIARRAFRPDLVLADYNLPGGSDGLEVASRIRDKLKRRISVVILTGDIAKTTLQAIVDQDCVYLAKPVKPQELTRVIQTLLPEFLSRSHAPTTVADDGAPTVFVVDDDDQVRRAIRSVLEEDGQHVEDFATCEAFLDAFQPGREACLLVDAYLPGIGGIELLEHLRGQGHKVPAIVITGHSDVTMAVNAMKAGAIDFIEKPVGRGELLAGVKRVLEQAHDATKLTAWRQAAAAHFRSLTIRQRDVLALVLAGHPSKNIAADLNISQRTVENHRAAIMKKTGAKSLPELARLSVAATSIVVGPS